MPIVGTAGHVDHGKSTLVQALTGTDPDRWAEEKERGLTIDLGFAWATIGVHDVGFVDVPGHERFIKNMLAGVGAIDCALFVVAADSGWMPQTEEHAAVLDLLGVDRGVIAVTRIDLTDGDTTELAILEIEEQTAGTSLEGWPIIPVSSPTGAGLTELMRAIEVVLDTRNPSDLPFRMWVDRSFTIAGAGQVVTGTITSGSVAVSDELEIQPSGDRVRVRGIQHHGRDVSSSVGGSRTAINISGASIALERGDLMAAPGTALATTRVLIELQPARTVGAIPDRGAFHLHVGTASRPAQLRRLGTSSAFIAQLVDPVAATVGDRIIVRDSGRRAVVGGGRILDPIPVQRPRSSEVDRLLEAIDGDPDQRADALIDVHGMVPTRTAVAAAGGGHPVDAVAAGSFSVSPAELSSIGEMAATETAAFHARNPVRPGIPKPELASRLGVPPPVLDAAIAASSELAEETGSVMVRGFTNEISIADEARIDAAIAAIGASFDVPRFGTLDIDTELAHVMLRRGDVVRVADDLVFTSSQVDEIRRRVAELPDGFTVSEFKDRFGMSRRQAVPTLEWLDSIGRTRRSGDGRIVRG